MARQLSFSGTTFSIENVSLSKEFVLGYDKAVEFVSYISNFGDKGDDIQTFSLPFLPPSLHSFLL